MEEADSSSTAAAVGLRFYSCSKLSKYAEKQRRLILTSSQMKTNLFFKNWIIERFICWLCRIEAEDFTSAIPIVPKDGHRRTSVGLHWLRVKFIMIKNAWTSWITLKRSDATWCNSDVDWLAWTKFLGENRAELGKPEGHVSCLPEAIKSSSVGKIKKIPSSRLTNLAYSFTSPIQNDSALRRIN